MLSDADFKVVYASGECEPLEFFIDGLLESVSFDLGLGYFSSSGFRALAPGFAYFINRGGKMRIIFNDILTKEDKEAIEKGLNSSETHLIERNLIKDILKLSETLSRTDRHFFNCISWLIATRQLEMIAVSPISKKPGIAHQKFGIFKDAFSNRVAFSGSINFSSNALFNNLEAISCYKSWTSDSSDIARIDYYSDLFDKVWAGKKEGVKIIPLEKVKVAIRDAFPVEDLDELLASEVAAIEEFSLNAEYPPELQKKLANLKRKIARSKNVFPAAPADGIPRTYQEDAVQKWIANDYKGLFEMATGTGKTVTGLNASINLLNSLQSIALLVLVPTISLAHQWKNEIKKFNYRSIVEVSSDNGGWEGDLQSKLNSFKIGTIKELVIISTYDSYKTAKFQKYYEKLPAQTLLIADEAHSMGAPEMLKKLPINIKYRLALSATPHRHFDDSGTGKFLDFFNAQSKSTFVFGMKDAIANQFLCQYKLFPHFAELTESEYEDYLDLTKQISQRSFFVKSQQRSSDSKLESLMQQRRRILNNASSKLSIVGQIIDAAKQLGDIHHTLVYCPEGNDENEDSKIIDELGKYLAFEKGLRIAHFTGETPAAKREELLKDFDSGKIQCLLAMKCLDEGVDVKRTETAIFVSSSTNPRQYIQRRGRVLRTHPNKAFAYIHDILAVPPKIEMDDPKAKEVDRIILTQEFSRYKEFAEDALNYVEAVNPVKIKCNEYKIQF